jgi:hypothetical protein
MRSFDLVEYPLQGSGICSGFLHSEPAGHAPTKFAHPFAHGATNYSLIV